MRGGVTEHTSALSPQVGGAVTMVTLTLEGTHRVHTHAVWTTHPEHHTLVHVCRQKQEWDRNSSDPSPVVVHSRVCVCVCVCVCVTLTGPVLDAVSGLTGHTPVRSSRVDTHLTRTLRGFRTLVHI